MMSGSTRGHRGRRFDKRNFVKNKNDLQEELEDSPVIKAFTQYRDELDYRNDKFERLVKISRDITIESKRIIFLLHTNIRPLSEISVLEEAKARLKVVINTLFFNIAKELNGEDPYVFTRAYYAGVQEFIEAYTYYHYLKTGELLTCREIQNDMTFKAVGVSDTENDLNEINLTVLLKPVEYILGVQDLTGELMRHCINSLTAGKFDIVFNISSFVHNICIGMSSLNSVPSRDYSKKLRVLKQSLGKIEYACFVVEVRGSEIPKDIIADVIAGQEVGYIEEDEGFY